MAIPNGSAPRLDGIEFAPVTIVADDAEANLNSVPPLTKSVVVSGVINGANDFIVLPPLNSCPSGHEITVLCKAASNFEMRTPASSGELINAQDSDGTKEYLCTDTEVMKVVKISNTVGWMAHAYSAVGAVVAAVVPD